MIKKIFKHLKKKAETKSPNKPNPLPENRAPLVGMQTALKVLAHLTRQEYDMPDGQNAAANNKSNGEFSAAGV